MSRVLTREGAYSQTSGSIYVAGVQAFMIYRLDMWVMTLHTGRVLGGFHHRMARRQMGRQSWIGRESGWVYPLLEEAMADLGLQEVDNYVS